MDTHGCLADQPKINVHKRTHVQPAGRCSYAPAHGPTLQKQLQHPSCVSAGSGSNQQDEWEPTLAQPPKRKSPALGHCSHLLLQFISFWNSLWSHTIKFVVKWSGFKSFYKMLVADVRLATVSSISCATWEREKLYLRFSFPHQLLCIFCH